MAKELSLGTLAGSALANLGRRISTLETETTLPVYTSSTLPSAPVSGEIVYSSDDSTLKTWNGSSWVSIPLS